MWTYWHESLKINICLCGILMFKFNNILHFKIGFPRKPEKNIYLETNGENGAKNQELFNCLLFPCVHFFHILFTFFHMFETHFFTFFQAHFQNACFPFFHKHVRKCEKMWKCGKIRFENAFGKKCEKMRFENALEKNVKNMWKNTFEHPVGKVELWFFRDQFCCSYFAACPTSASWKSERSSSNRSEVDCADRRSVQYIYSKEMTTRSKNIKSNAKEREQHFKIALKNSLFHICLNI